jgi:mRNA interferase HigB
MHVISKKALRDFWELHPEAKAPLLRWHKLARFASWKNLAQVKQELPSADVCGRCVMFNIGGNKFRLVAAVHYNTQRIYVRNVLTHAEYDRGQWREDCERPPDSRRHA